MLTRTSRDRIPPRNDLHSNLTAFLFAVNSERISCDLGEVKRLMYIMILSNYNVSYSSLCSKIASSSRGVADTDGNAPLPYMPSDLPDVQMQLMRLRSFNTHDTNIMMSLI